MSAAKGWTGTMLTIDLAHQKISTQALPENWSRMYIGARGFAVRLLYDLTGPETDPLGPENVVIVAAGPLTGTMPSPVSTHAEMWGALLDRS